MTPACARFGACVAPLLGAALLGCGAGQGSGAAVSAAALQEDLSGQLAAAGMTPLSVTCPQGLAGEAGKTARCEIVLSEANSFEAVVTATKVTGDSVTYDVTPAATREQLAQTVSRLTGATSAECAGGVDGEVGQSVECQVTKDGATLTRIVKVSGVDGLAMNLAVLPLLTRQQLEGLLLDRLAADSGQRPASAECAGDLQGEPGNSVNCTVAGGSVYVLTVTSVDGDRINFEATPQSSEAPS